MNSDRKHPFDVVVNGVRKGGMDGDWMDKVVSVDSIWDRGSEQEKFEVLSALRKTYNRNARADIRGESRQTPSQIAQSEGFTRLSYRAAELSAVSIPIVNVFAGYSRLVINKA